MKEQCIEGTNEGQVQGHRRGKGVLLNEMASKPFI